MKNILANLQEHKNANRFDSCCFGYPAAHADTRGDVARPRFAEGYLPIDFYRAQMEMELIS